MRGFTVPARNPLVRSVTSESFYCTSWKAFSEGCCIWGVLLYQLESQCSKFITKLCNSVIICLHLLSFVGESIAISADFENHSSRTIIPYATLHQTQTFFANGKSRIRGTKFTVLTGVYDFEQGCLQISPVFSWYTKTSLSRETSPLSSVATSRFASCTREQSHMGCSAAENPSCQPQHHELLCHQSGVLCQGMGGQVINSMKTGLIVSCDQAELIA